MRTSRNSGLAGGGNRQGIDAAHFGACENRWVREPRLEEIDRVVAPEDFPVHDERRYAEYAEGRSLLRVSAQRVFHLRRAERGEVGYAERAGKGGECLFIRRVAARGPHLVEYAAH